MAPAPTDEIVTSTPRAKPSTTVRTPTVELACAVHEAREAGEQRLAKDKRNRGHDQRDSERRADDAPARLGGRAEMREQEERQQRRRHASIGEAPGDPPIDRAVIGMHRPAADLGDARIEQIGADGGRRMDSEDQHKQRRHQRAAAHPGDANQQSDGQPGNGEGRIYAMQHLPSLFGGLNSNVDGITRTLARRQPSRFARPASPCAPEARDKRRKRPPKPPQARSRLQANRQRQARRKRSSR